MRTLILGLAAAAAAAVEVGASSSLPSISQLLEADARYSTFVEALYATDLYDALDAYGPYTVFAPTNRAFAALDAYVRTALLKNKRQLKHLVLNHVVGAATLTTELVDGDELESLARHALLVRVGSSMRVDDAEVVEFDELASNGVLDGLGDVLVPCPDDPAWAKKNQPEMKCEWVLEHGPRCDAKGENNIPAWYGCPFACDAGCADSDAWHKEGEPSKSCEWVVEKPDTRCAVIGEDATAAQNSCPTACSGGPPG
mmetsp:Transcript_21867/g.67335  ORF Transcript_21867/g.67335 Transcript_21867/m.67335 type:complete len:256 (-) Transcript_21867:28-795(-)